MPAKITLARCWRGRARRASSRRSAVREGEDPLGDAGRVHDVAHQDEQRRRQQRKRDCTACAIFCGTIDRLRSAEPDERAWRRAPIEANSGTPAAWRANQTPTIWSISVVTAPALPGRATCASRVRHRLADLDRRLQDQQQRRAGSRQYRAPRRIGSVIASMSHVASDEAAGRTRSARSRKGDDRDLHARSRRRGAARSGSWSINTGCGCAAPAGRDHPAGQGASHTRRSAQARPTTPADC